MKKQIRLPRINKDARGFALIVTIALMALLSVIVIGMLSTATIAVRTSEQSSNLAIAQSNARMALALAIGDLQKFAGPDQRITASASIVDEGTPNPHLTGVWRSTEFTPGNLPVPADYSQNSRDDKFLSWLSSSMNDRQDLVFQGANPSDPVELWAEGSLGSAPVSDYIAAQKIPTASGGIKGKFAYAVMDEGVKARINTPALETPGTVGGKTAMLGAGSHPKVSYIPGLEALTDDQCVNNSEGFKRIEKGISRDNLGLAAKSFSPGLSEQMKTLTHDVTPYSQGLLTNTAKGGLKKDLHLLTKSNTLPADFAGEGVYKTELDLDVPSDPTWDSLKDLARLYSKEDLLRSQGGLPVLKANTPAGWEAATGSTPNSQESGTINPAPPQGVVLMPTVAKVQLVFSLLTRDIYRYPGGDGSGLPKNNNEEQDRNIVLHHPWGENFAGSDYDYLLHLLYTPVVTLRNPYNVTLEFEELKVMFGNVPFGLQVIRNGIPQTNGLTPLDSVFAGAWKTGKRFGMTLKTKTEQNRPGQTVFRLRPGEVMLFSPYLDPDRTARDEYDTGKRTFLDWDSAYNGSNRTKELQGMPGWRGDGIGFDADWFCPSYNNLRVSSVETEGTGESQRSMSRGGTIGARAKDEFQVKFAPINIPELSDNKFNVEIFAKNPNTGGTVSSGLIQLDYQTSTGLQDELLGSNGTLTYPKNDTINTLEMHSHSNTPIKNISLAKPFCVVSAQAKATLGGLNADGEDGKYATKPWAFAHGETASSMVKVNDQGLENASHEYAFQRLDSGTDNLLQFDPLTGRGNAITGQTGNTGLKFGALYDIPLAPLQSMAQLNSANPGGSSAYLPRFAQPIGNSWAHPMLDTDKALTPGGDYAYADHSFLLNLALYDDFYFSNLAAKTGAFGNGSSTSDLADNFANNLPLTDPRLQFHHADNKPTSEFMSDVVNADDGYRKMAAWQTVKGAFNVNSTSVAAWKAMLGSVHDPEAIFFDATADSPDISPLDSIDENESRISRFRLPASQSMEDSNDPTLAYWLGARKYTDTELQPLAEQIVVQVRERGPFLSMADFVNRQLGPAGDQKAQEGALQQAIDLSGLNPNSTGAGYEITSAKISDYHYANPEAGEGRSDQGAPGYLTQADILNVLGNAATARSDTFTVRGYGEATGSDGTTVLATAVCEAIVQRTPEYLDNSDPAETLPENLSALNQQFGRRFTVLSFRWLSPSEI